MVLERYSKPLSATEWQLTEKSSLQAMDNGFSADKFKEFLLENSEQKNLATEVNYFFKAAFERENALTDMGSARLLHCYSKPFATCWQMHAKPNNIAAMQEIRPWLSLKKRKRNLHRAYVS